MTGRARERFWCRRRSRFLQTLARCTRRRGGSRTQMEEGHRNDCKGSCIFPSIAGRERQGRLAMSGAGGALRHPRRAALAVQCPRRRMLSPGNPRACHIHQHQQRMRCRTHRLLQHPSAKRGARRHTARVLRLGWGLMRSPI